MTNLILASKGIGEELAKVLPVLIFGILVTAGQWLKNRGGKPSVDEPSNDERPAPRTMFESSMEDVFRKRQDAPPPPATIAAGRVPMEMLRRESAEQDR